MEGLEHEVYGRMGVWERLTMHQPRQQHALGIAQTGRLP